MFTEEERAKFKQRFAAYKNGKKPYDAGRPLPIYEYGKEDDDINKVPSDKRARAIYNAIDPRGSVPSGYWEASKMEARVRRKMYFGNPDKKEYELEPTVADSVADAAWRKRLGYGYNKKFLIPYKEDAVSLPKEIEVEIPTDTTMLKNRIANTERLMKYSNKYKNNKYIRIARDVDQQALDALRKTYKTGRPVTINEHSFNSRLWVNDGEVLPTMSPLNVLGNFEIWYDKVNNRMNYGDTYDFNKYDWAIPGESFPIRGSIQLSPKK